MPYLKISKNINKQQYLVTVFENKRQLLHHIRSAVDPQKLWWITDHLPIHQTKFVLTSGS